MLDPQARAYIDWMIQRGAPPVQSTTPQQARQFYEERRALTQPDPPEVAEVRGHGGDERRRQLQGKRRACVEEGECKVTALFVCEKLQL